jgi:hypothetical protein
MITIDDIKKILPELCHKFKIRYVDIFGSIARNDSKEESDIDVVIEFEDPIEENISERYFGFLHGLEDAFQRHVDVLTPRAIKNPYLRKSIEREKIRIYG